MKANQCPECFSFSLAPNRRLWHRQPPRTGKRIEIMQMKCRTCGRLFIPPGVNKGGKGNGKDKPK